MTLQEIIDIYKLITSEDIINNLERNIASNFLMMRRAYNCHWVKDYIHNILFYNGEVSKQTEAIIEYLKAEISYLNEQKECVGNELKRNTKKPQKECRKST